MSAFMVSKEHIDAIMAVIGHGPSDKAPTYLEWKDRMEWANILPKFDTAQAINDLGDLLIRENLSSIHARYPDTIDNPDRTPGPIAQYWFTPYQFKAPPRVPTVVEAFKLLDCYEYQSCEHEEWPNSRACEVCRKLRAALIPALSGYDAAPWEWDTTTV
jgi:hypothetical protein